MGDRSKFKTRPQVCCVAAILFLALAIAPHSARADDALPTSEELHKLFDDGQYAPLLAKIAKVQRLGEAANTYDQVYLGMLKAEALIAQKQQQSALRATEEAARAISADTPRAQIAKLHALHTLLFYARNNLYTSRHAPKDAKPQPIPIDLATRRDAYTALLIDLQIDATAKMDAVKTSSTLPALTAAIAVLNDIAPVEQMIRKPDADTQRDIDSLCDQAKGLIDDTITPMAKRVDRLKEEANETITIRVFDGMGGVRSFSSKRGLIKDQPAELRTIFATCDKARAACEELARLTPRRIKDFKPLFTTADKAAKDADKLLRQFRK